MRIRIIHITNLEDADYSANVAGGVRALYASTSGSWCGIGGGKKEEVANTAELMGIVGSYSAEEATIRLKDVMALWGNNDPVHPSSTAYDNLAKAMLELVRAKTLSKEGESSASQECPRGCQEAAGGEDREEAGLDRRERDGGC